MYPCAATKTAFSSARCAVALTASGPSSRIGCLGLWKVCKFSEKTGMWQNPCKGCLFFKTYDFSTDSLELLMSCSWLTDSRPFDPQVSYTKSDMSTGTESARRSDRRARWQPKASRGHDWPQTCNSFMALHPTGSVF